MQEAVGGIAPMLRNDEGLYEGDLIHYFRVLMFHAQNIRHPYHNLRHMLHVAWLCHEALRFYTMRGIALPYSSRHLLVSALMHDFDHSGQLGDDDLNIERAVRGLKRHADKRDQHAIPTIETLIRWTQYPHQVASSELNLYGQILRDADVSQALSVAWLQQIVVGLSGEWGKPLTDVLRLQLSFHREMQFATEWARDRFPRQMLTAKAHEAEALLRMLE